MECPNSIEMTTFQFLYNTSFHWPPTESIFLYSSTRSSGHYQSFFIISDFLAESLKARKKLPKKITHFAMQFRSKSLTHFMNLNSLDIENNMLPQRNQKPFWLYYKFFSKHVSVWCQKKHLHSTVYWRPKLHSWSVLKANVPIFLYKSVRKVLFQRYSKILSDRGSAGGRLNDSIKAARCLAS